MPQYEYVCEEDGSRITLLRPMRDAEAPVDDPEGRGRVFQLALSMPLLGATRSDAGSSPVGGMCGCGRPHGGCGAG